MRRRESGFSLIELMIAITLVAAISAGLLTAMRNGLLTVEKTQSRLDDARRAIGVQDLIRRQIGAAVPARGICTRDQLQQLVPIFRGDNTQMLMVSSQSMTEGARGALRLLYYRVQSNRDGSYRLEMTEMPFSGPFSTANACDPAPGILRIPESAVKPVVLLDNLAACQFRYRSLSFDTLLAYGPWLDKWIYPFLPFSVVIEMQPGPKADTRMPIATIAIPLHVSRNPDDTYADE